VAIGVALTFTAAEVVLGRGPALVDDPAWRVVVGWAVTGALLVVASSANALVDVVVRCVVVVFLPVVTLWFPPLHAAITNASTTRTRNFID
jgi:hypothetical protein